jgi:hypothetical protein
MNNIDLNKYKDFVGAVTSRPSNDMTDFVHRIDTLTAEKPLNQYSIVDDCLLWFSG